MIDVIAEMSHRKCFVHTREDGYGFYIIQVYYRISNTNNCSRHIYDEEEDDMNHFEPHQNNGKPHQIYRCYYTNIQIHSNISIYSKQRVPSSRNNKILSHIHTY